MTSLSRARVFATPWTVVYKAPLSMEFTRQEYWSGLSFPSPGDLPDPRIEPRSPALCADALPSEPPGKPIYADDPTLMAESEEQLKSLLMKVKVTSLSRARLFATLWTVVYKVPLSMEFSRQEYWSGLPFPSPGDLPDPGIKPRSPALQADALPSEPPI